MLRDALDTVEASLQRQSPSFHVANKHVAYYYQKSDVLFSQSERSFLITISIPISSRSATYDLFQIRTFPVPLNHTTQHVTLLSGMPDYLAMSHDRQNFLELTTADYLYCTQGPIRHCPTVIGARSVDKPSCSVSLLLHDMSTHNECKLTVKEDGLTTYMMELSPGRVLLSNVDKIIFMCDNDVRQRQGCLFCVINVPCGCALAVGNMQIPPRVSACVVNTGDVTIEYPINLGLLREFFNDSEIKHLTTSSLLPQPLEFTIPDLHIYDKNFQKAKLTDKKLEAGLSLVTQKMKEGKPVLRDSFWTDFPADTSDWGWQQILNYVTFALSVILALAVIALYRRLRTLCMIVAMLSNPTPGMLAVKASNVTDQPSLTWRSSVTRPTSHELTTSNTGCVQNAQTDMPNTFLLTLEVLSLILLLLCLIRWGQAMYGTMLYRSDVYLEITNGYTFVDIYLITLTYCPSEYDLTLPYWVHSLSLLKHMVGADDLRISWPKFELLELRTGQVIQLPKTIKLSLLQWLRIKRVIANNYQVHPKVVHGGKAFYLSLKQREPVSNMFDQDVSNASLPRRAIQDNTHHLYPSAP